MLDNLKTIHERDGRDMLGAAGSQAKQLAWNCKLPNGLAMSLRSVKATGQKLPVIRTVVFAGGGEPALAATVAKSWLGSEIGLPFEIVQGHDGQLPPYINDATLCVVDGYQLRPEAVSELLAQAAAKQARVVVLAADDGSAAQWSAPVVMMPVIGRGAPYRHTPMLWPSLVTITAVLGAAGLVGSNRTIALQAEASWLEGHIQAWLPQRPTDRNQAKHLALEIAGKSVVVSAGPRLAPAAMSWKYYLNYYAKHLAWLGQYADGWPEELAGWTRQPIHKPYAIIELCSEFDQPATSRLVKTAGRLLSGRRPAPIAVVPVGTTALQHMLYGVVLGNFVAIYLALLSGIDPAPAEWSQEQKE